MKKIYKQAISYEFMEEHNKKKDLKEINVNSKTIEELEDQSGNLKKIEASLFIAGRYLSLKDLITLTDINPILLKELLERLVEKYESDNTAITIVKKQDSWKMDVKSEYTSFINKLATGSAEFTKAEQETLAIIAYKQPVKQSVVVKIRGNKAYDHIRNFIKLGLVKAKKAGHTKELNLSEEFYDYFHIRKSNFNNSHSEESE